ncbi:hypothetical protein SLEP1_g6497 [Rubroshorea leprosula]|uniref:Secreted protein n=1 Tax=Rubroshorea leprosula TaxID=152421 RepID=A0AAV5I3H6_9ROSI|nr:hypothetical protein SLEP1_g6497 [Rubroshorea leprosula]
MTSFLFLLFLSFFSSSSSPRVLLFSFPLQPPERKRRGTQPCLGKLVRKLGGFSFLSCSRTQIEPRNFPSPCWKTGSAMLCSSPPAAPACGGRIAWVLDP